MSASYFDAYDKLARSGLFDAAYYRSANPEVAANNIDPLLHFLEHGAKAGRPPSSRFDLDYYLRQCRAAGERPENPLLHYLDGGFSRGFHIAHAASPIVETPSLRLFIDSPVVEGDLAAAVLHNDLAVNGWALARNGVDAVSIFVDDRPAATALYGIHRRDVAAEFPDWADAARSGFAAVVPYRLFGPGSHDIRVTVTDRSGETISRRFRIRAGDLDDPWQIKTKISHAETKFYELQLARMEWHPRFVIMMNVGKQETVAARRSIQSLRRQPYPEWRLLLLAADSAGARELADLDERIGLCPGKLPPFHSRERPTLVGMLAAGDELSCDALLQFAVSTGRRGEADFIYGDERRLDAAGRDTAYLKPDWSPDLLHATNYIGCPWFASATLFARIAFDPARDRAFDVVLKCTELAKTVVHIPALLCQRGAPSKARDDGRALTRALARTKIDGEILPGLVAGHFRLKRHLTARPRVSIVIPTCGARALIKRCVGSLRAITRYQPIEIIVIENIPDRHRELKDWLRAHTDQCIAITEEFNWSRFNNLAASRATGDYLLFLNDDTEVIEPEWLDALMEHALRPDIAAVGPLLLYPDRTIQHAGVFIAAGAKGGRHFFRFAKSDPGYFGWALTERNVGAVTGACLLTGKATFEALGRFDENHRIINNDVDYCLRALRRGMRNVFTPYARLIHHELASRSDLPESYDAESFGHAWRDILFDGDPYYHPALVRDSDIPAPEAEPIEVIHPAGPLLDRRLVRRILLVKLDHIGDTVTALPAARRLREAFPDADFFVLAATATANVWSRQDFIREVIAFDFFHPQSSRGKRDLAPTTLDALEHRLRPYEFDLAVDLRKHLETRPILRHTGARFLAGFDRDRAYPWLDIAVEWEIDRKGAPKRQHVTDDLLDLANAIATRCRDEPPALAPTGARLPRFPRHRSGALFDRAVVCLHPSVGADVRQWPASYFAALADRLIERNEVHIAIVGGPDDAAVAAELMERIEHPESVWNLVGKLTLEQLPNLLARCALFVGNNSGPQHIAAGLGMATIGIHSGQIDPKEWGPLGASAVAIRRRMSCAPCYLERAADCPREMACLNKLLPGDVYRLCHAMLH